MELIIVLRHVKEFQRNFFFDLSGVSFILFDFFFLIHGKSGNSMYTKQH